MTTKRVVRKLRENLCSLGGAGAHLGLRCHCLLYSLHVSRPTLYCDSGLKLVCCARNFATAVNSNSRVRIPILRESRSRGNPEFPFPLQTSNEQSKSEKQPERSQSMGKQSIKVHFTQHCENKL